MQRHLQNCRTEFDPRAIESIPPLRIFWYSAFHNFDSYKIEMSQAVAWKIHPIAWIWVSGAQRGVQFSTSALPRMIFNLEQKIILMQCKNIVFLFMILLLTPLEQRMVNYSLHILSLKFSEGCILLWKWLGNITILKKFQTMIPMILE